MLGTLNNTQIEYVLRSGVWGRIGCVTDDRVYIVPVSYVYDGQAIYGHSVEGLKLEMMRKHPQVCFQVDQVHDLANWQSIIAWGTFEELQGDEAQHALQLFVERMEPFRTSETALSGHVAIQGDHALTEKGQAASMFRIKLTDQTGRFEKQE